MTKYEITGKPGGYAGSFTILQDRVIGDVVDANLDDDEETTLIDLGAIRVLDRKEAKAKEAEAKQAEEDAEEDEAPKKTTTRRSSK